MNDLNFLPLYKLNLAPIHCIFWVLAGVIMPATGSAQSNFAKELKLHISQVKKEHLKDPRSPLQKSDLQKLKYFAANEDFIIEAKYEAMVKSDSVIMPTSSGKLKYFVKAAKVSFEVDEVKYQLFMYKPASAAEGYRSLFLPFYDLTNGTDTYGGGRYMDLEAPDSGQTIIKLDFNKAYNPWCAYSDGFNCPIPPEDNRLTISVWAGEKMYKGKRRGGSKSSNKK